MQESHNHFFFKAVVKSVIYRYQTLSLPARLYGDPLSSTASPTLAETDEVRGAPIAQKIRSKKVVHCNHLPAFIQLAFSTVSPLYGWMTLQMHFNSQPYG